MRPLELTMQAFGSYGKKTKVDLTVPDQNFFLITGDTGAGKTTIFDAMVFALYGETGSGSNKKDGMELQGQFADYTAEPYVELVFSEKNGEGTEIYTVRRVPRHMRPLKRGSGIREESGTVSLTMPDGTEYPQKETDRKLEEIVGLTKEQFMQVAMIAQGEFMELLRARSDDKKGIFRKLFHTELFQGIVDELAGRRKGKASDIAQIRTICQTETGHISVPEDYGEAEALLEIRRRIMGSDRLSVTDMEDLLDGLKRLCDQMKQKKEDSQKAYDELSKLRDGRRDALTNAQGLLKAFEQLEEAERELEECEAAEKEIRETAGLIAAINAAYEIKAVHQRFLDAQETVGCAEAGLKEQQESLPGLEEDNSKAAEGEALAKRQQEAELEASAKVTGRVEKARELFGKIKAAEDDVARREKELKAAGKAAAQAQAQLGELEEREREWRRLSEELRDADKLLTLWNIKSEAGDRLAAELADAQKEERGVRSQKKKADKAQQEYAAARQEFADRNAEYLAKQTAFLDAQAGFIAREKLRPGEPCPVCGSLEHPKPCMLSAEHQDLTRGMIEALGGEVDLLRQKQQDKAGAAGSASDLLLEKTKHLEETVGKLRESMTNHLEVQEDFTLSRAEELLAAWRQSVETEGATVRQNADMFAQAQESLKDVDERKRALAETATQTAHAAVEAKAVLAGALETLERLKGDRDYQTMEEADAALAAAAAVKDEADAAYRTAARKAREAGQKMDKAVTLIRRYQQELPGQKEECARRREAYEESMAQRDLSETEWMDITQKYPQSEKDSLQAKVDAHNKRKATAEGRRESARKAVDGQTRPDIGELEHAWNEAEERLGVVREELEWYKEIWQVDARVYDALAPRMEERARIMQDYARLDSLYNRLAGKVTGSRMDIETFVQRYYLQRILYAANVRFQDMSAGQFELRMVDVGQAGEGRNRGLDLMVYSTVTGKEREVRTLSGGESFMAALSLALGMADQIQESSAAINLDILFIDEGFGSLDERSRTQAVRVLQRMAGGSRLIGIISHVTELKQEIEDQLIVSKDEEGSHVRWQVS